MGAAPALPAVPAALPASPLIAIPPVALVPAPPLPAAPGLLLVALVPAADAPAPAAGVDSPLPDCTGLAPLVPLVSTDSACLSWPPHAATHPNGNASKQRANRLLRWRVVISAALHGSRG